MSQDDEASREAILARRRRFLALALSGAATASTAACAPCLAPPHDGGGDAARDAGTDAPEDAGTSDEDAP